MALKLTDISIRWQILVFCILLISIPVIIISINTYISSRSDTLKNLKSWADERVQSSYRSVNNVNGTTKEQLKTALSATRLVVIKVIAGVQTIDLKDFLVEMITYDQITKSPKKDSIKLMTINDKPILQRDTGRRCSKLSQNITILNH